MVQGAAALALLLAAADLGASLTPAAARLAGVKARGSGRRRPRLSANLTNAETSRRGRAAVADEARFRAVESDGPAPDVLGCLDFECTCENSWDYVHEIIEVPVVLVDAASGDVLDAFHAYVKPTENATLSAFCTDLTGIAQATVDAAKTLPEVLADLDAWLREKGLVGDGADATFALATDGWDLAHFLDNECARKGLAKPGAYLDSWVDVSQAFALRRRAKDRANGRKKGRSSRRVNLPSMLRHHRLPLEGRLHSGIDDATNLARVVGALRENHPDWPLRTNDALPRLKEANDAWLSEL